MKKTLYRYLLKELFPVFFLGLLGFTFVLLTGRILQLADLFVNKRVPASFLFQLLYYLLPSFLVLTIPMATLISVLMAFHRLSSDNEIMALKASGISLYQMTPPVILLALFAYGSSLFLSIYSLPRANLASRSLIFEIASTKAHAGVRERVFNDDFEGLVLYVERVDPDRLQWKHIFISDSRNPDEVHTIIAPEGEVLSDPEKLTVTLKLKNGSIHKLGKKAEVYQIIHFRDYDLRLDLGASWKEAQKTNEKHVADMSLSELTNAIRELKAQNLPARPQWVKIHEKFSIPFACIVFALVGIPLGVSSKAAQAGRSMGFAWSIGVLLVYYLLTNAGTSLAERGRVSMELGMWTTNGVFLVLGIYLFIKAANESPVWLLLWVNRAMESLRRRWGSSWRSRE